MFTLKLDDCTNYDVRESVESASHIAKTLNVEVQFVFRGKVIYVYPDTEVESKIYDMEHIYFY